MDHDRLFKQLLTTFFVEFIELFLPELSAHLHEILSSFWIKRSSPISPAASGTKWTCWPRHA